MILSTLLSVLIISCATTTKAEIILPPKPQRKMQNNATSVKEMAELVVYYDSLIQEWELWGNDVESIVSKEK